jgi:hypothetical protein
MSHYHKRVEYEKLLLNLSKEAKMPVDKNYISASDYQVLYMINLRLNALGLETFDSEELELELH